MAARGRTLRGFGQKKRRAFSAAGPAFCLLPLLKNDPVPIEIYIQFARLPAQVVISRAKVGFAVLCGPFPAFHRRCDGAVGDGVPACRVPRHAAKRATLRLADASSARFPLWNPLRQNFTANRALGAQLLAHNLPQNFPVGVAVVGACPPTATEFNFFDNLWRRRGQRPLGCRRAAARCWRRSPRPRPQPAASPSGQHRGRVREQAGLPAKAAPGQARSAATRLSC